MNKIKDFKKDFPIFQRRINGQKLVYLDSASTSQKPKVVIDAISSYYKTYNANIRRGLYPIAEKATEKVEEVREKVAKFINAKDPREVVFTRNTTEAVNLVAYAFASHNIKKGDSVITTIMEHHSNFVPWQQLAKMKKAKFEVLDFGENFQFFPQSGIPRSGTIFNFKSNPNVQNVKIFAITQISNVLGVINPLGEIIREVKKINPKIKVLVDAAQSVPHMKVDVQKMDCDFLAFSGHKMLAGTGIGILYGKKELLSQMPPFLYGGEMIKEVKVKNTSFADLPFKFEAGTPDISGIISLGAAVDYLNEIGMNHVQEHEQQLVAYCLSLLAKIDGLTIYGPALAKASHFAKASRDKSVGKPKTIRNRSGVISFNINGIHPHDVAQILGDMGICIRSGHHCAMPLHKRLGVPATARVSFYLYNDRDDIDKFIEGIKKVKKIFKV